MKAGETIAYWRLGLIGGQLGHSLSPRLQRAALQSAGLRGEYRLYAVPPLPEGEAQLRALVEGLRAPPALRLHGLNVTIPHKQNVLAYLDELTPIARAVGAVNTLYAEGSRLIGENTDAPGFWADFERLWQAAGDGAQPATALVLGGGGAARAVAYALLQHGWRAVLATRRLEQGKQVVRDLKALHLPGTIAAIPLEAARLARMRAVRAVINATPLGMSPHTDECPYPPELALPDEAVVYDLVYNPAETVLLRRARQQGLPAANGLGMLVEQARLAFACWTGITPPGEALWAALRQPNTTPQGEQR
ncbi:MAG: shikimate dehydrogenase [Chloroflexota bacterium]|nr:MAG: shikimate dehydrogenase (NADP(+)) [Bellilinea sp.]